MNSSTFSLIVSLKALNVNGSSTYETIELQSGDSVVVYSSYIKNDLNKKWAKWAQLFVSKLMDD